MPRLFQEGHHIFHAKVFLLVIFNCTRADYIQYLFSGMWADRAELGGNVGFYCTLADYSQHLFSGMWANRAELGGNTGSSCHLADQLISLCLGMQVSVLTCKGFLNFAKGLEV
jgi:hypothetical protein